MPPVWRLLQWRSARSENLPLGVERGKRLPLRQLRISGLGEVALDHRLPPTACYLRSKDFARAVDIRSGGGPSVEALRETTPRLVSTRPDDHVENARAAQAASAPISRTGCCRAAAECIEPEISKPDTVWDGGALDFSPGLTRPIRSDMTPPPWRAISFEPAPSARMISGSP